ncbi:MAG TPA: hypothetical protein VF624_19305, partial [Tepidisphaeraceae bacterium]
MGAFWRTGYALTNEQTGFSTEWFMQHAVGYLQMLAGSGVGPMFALGFVGMVWMIFLPRRRAVAMLLLLSVVPFVMLYMAYYWAAGVGGGGPGGGAGGRNNAGAMRFMVPVVPLFILAAAWALHEALRGATRGAKVAVPVTLLVLQALTYGSNVRDDLRQSAERKLPLALATQGIEDVAAEGDVVVGNPALLQHLDFIRKWKLADRSVVTGRGPGGGRFALGPRGENDGDRPSPQQQAKNEARAKLYARSTAEKQQQFQDDVIAWAGRAAIYAVGSGTDLDGLIPGVRGDELVIVKRLSTPKPKVEPDAQRGNRFGGGGRGAGAGLFGGGGPGGGRGGPMGTFVTPGDEIVIARWTPATTDMLAPEDFR